MSRKGQLASASNKLVPLALVLVTVSVVVGVGAIILTEMKAPAYNEPSVSNETFNATSDPIIHTTTKKSSDSDFVELTSVTCYKGTAQSTALADDSCTISDAEAGKVNVSTAVDSGNESIDYNYYQKSDSSGIMATGITALTDMANFFTIIVVVGIAAVIFLLLRVVRVSGKSAAA